MCVAAYNREKFDKILYFGGFSVLINQVIDVGTPGKLTSAVLVIICSKFVSICNRSHGRRINNGKITIS